MDGHLSFLFLLGYKHQDTTVLTAFNKSPRHWRVYNMSILSLRGYHFVCSHNPSFIWCQTTCRWDSWWCYNSVGISGVCICRWCATVPSENLQVFDVWWVKLCMGGNWEASWQSHVSKCERETSIFFYLALRQNEPNVSRAMGSFCVYSEESIQH